MSEKSHFSKSGIARNTTCTDAQFIVVHQVHLKYVRGASSRSDGVLSKSSHMGAFLFSSRCAIIDSMNKGLIIHTLILNEKKQILLTRRSKVNDVLSGYWDAPGGTLEDGEDPYVGAQREVREEVGLEIDKLQLFFCKSNIDSGKNKQFITMLFYALYKGGDIKLNPDEHDKYMWVDFVDIKDYQTVDYLPQAVQILSPTILS